MVDMAVDPAGDYLYVLEASSGTTRVRKVATDTGVVTTLYSASSPASPTNIKVGPDGNVWIAARDGSYDGIYQIDGSGTLTLMVEGLIGYYGDHRYAGGAFAFSADGDHLYYMNGWGVDDLQELTRIAVSSLPADGHDGTKLGYAGSLVRGEALDMGFGADGHLYLNWTGTGPGGAGYPPILFRFNGSTFADVEPGSYWGERRRFTFSPGSDRMYVLCGTGCRNGESRTLAYQDGFGSLGQVRVSGGVAGFENGNPGKMGTSVGLAISADGRTAWIADSGNTRIRVAELPEPPLFAASEFFGANPTLRHQCPCQATAADPVDTRTGNLHMPIPGVSVAGRGPGLSVGLAYNSLNTRLPFSGRISRGWSTTLDMSLVVRPDGSAVVKQEGGSTVPFEGDATSGWVAPERFSATLVDNSDGTVTFTRGHFESFTFASATGRLVAVEDQFGNETTMHYPGSSTFPDYMEDEAGRRLSFTWSSGRLATITDPLPAPEGGPRVATFTYSGSPNFDLVSYEDMNGGTWTFTYDGSSHRMLTMRKPNNQPSGPVVENSYDSAGRVQWQEDELDRRTTFEYDTPALDSTRITNPDGMVRVDSYVGGRREKTTIGVGTPAETETIYAYDPGTLALESVTDNAGEVTTFTNDANGNRLSMEDPTGRITRFTYNGFDQPLTVATGEIRTGPTSTSTDDVVVSEFSYDSQGLVTSSVEAAGTAVEAETLYTYGDGSHPEDLTEVTDPRGKDWTFTYDPDTGDQLTATDPLGHTTETGYNSIGWPVTITAPKGVATPGVADDYQTTIAYDVVNRTVTTTGPSGEVSRTTTDAGGFTVASAVGITGGNPTGDVTTYDYDAAGQMVETDLPGAGVRAYTYTDEGLVETFSNENSNVWTYGYDDIGRQVSAQDPAGGVTRYAYDSAGRLATVTKPDAGATCVGTKVACVTYSYDDAGRPEGVDYSDPQTPDLSGVVYDALGRRTEATLGSATEEWTWDPRSRLTAHVDVNGRDTTYGWDLASNLTEIGYPGITNPLVRGFDDAGRLVSVTDWSSRVSEFDYDADGNWTDTVFPAASQNTDHYSYDESGRMVGVEWKRGASVLGSLSYDPRDAKGLVTSVTAAGAATKSTSWSYDGRGQLTADGSESFAYDPAANLVEKTDGTLQVFDPAQRLCWSSPTASSGDCTTPSTDATTYAYDASGNRTTKTAPSGTESTYSYDAENRMTSATVPDAFSPESNQLRLVTPARVADSTTGTGTCDGAPCATLDAADPVEVQVAGVGGVPATGAVAVTGTITAIDPVGDGWISINPSGDAAAGTVTALDAAQTTSSFTAELTAGKLTIDTDVDTDVAIDISGYFTAPNLFVPASNYWSITPDIVADTGSGVGTCDGVTCATLAAGSTDIDVTAADGYPAGGATAVTVSVIGSTSGGPARMRINPNGTAAAGELVVDNSLNGAAGQFTAVVSGSGTITIETDVTSNVILMVNGWWRAPTSTTDLGTGFTPLDDGAQRLVDTRDGTGTCDDVACDTLTANTPVAVAAAGELDIPANATAVVASVSVHDPAAAGVVLAGDDPATIGVPIVYDTTGTSATITVPVEQDTGLLHVTAWTNTDITIDISGYFTRPTTTYTYDYGIGGIRTAKERTDNAGWRTEYTWTATGGLPLLLSQHTGTNTSRIIYGPAGTPIYQLTATGDVLYYHQDHQGSTRLVTNTNGTTRGAITYDAYGKTTADTTPWYLERPLLGYTGQYTDTETGFIYLRARHYDPTTAQFTTQDPIVAQTKEPYGYTSGNPANATDPAGLSTCGDLSLGGLVDCGAKAVDDLAGTDICIDNGGEANCQTIAEQEGGTVNGLQALGKEAYDNRGYYASIYAGLVCLVASWGVCATASVSAFALRSSERLGEHQSDDDQDLQSIAKDGLLTYVFLMLGGQGAFLSRSPLDDGAGLPWWVEHLYGLPSLIYELCT
jgi:RHS repeat-associated protein